MAIKDIVQEVLHSSIDHQTKVLVTKAQLVGTQSVQVRVIARSSNSGDNSEINIWFYYKTKNFISDF